MKKSLVLAMAMALGVTASAYAANPFSDVPAGHWAYDSVNKLAAAGIVDGYGNGTFGGDRLMTRYEMAQIVAKAMAKGARHQKCRCHNRQRYQLPPACLRNHTPNGLPAHRRRDLQHRQKQLRPMPLPLQVLKIFSCFFPPRKFIKPSFSAHNNFLRNAPYELPSFLYGHPLFNYYKL